MGATSSSESRPICLVRHPTITFNTTNTHTNPTDDLTIQQIEEQLVGKYYCLVFHESEGVFKNNIIGNLRVILMRTNRNEPLTAVVTTLY